VRRVRTNSITTMLFRRNTMRPMRQNTNGFVFGRIGRIHVALRRRRTRCNARPVHGVDFHRSTQTCCIHGRIHLPNTRTQSNPSTSSRVVLLFFRGLYHHLPTSTQLSFLYRMLLLYHG